MKQHGFTLLELLAVGGIIVVGLTIAVIVINPRDYSVRARNVKRQLDVAQLVQAVSRYKEDNGKLPGSIGPLELIISSDAGDADICTDLVPKYLKDLPIDPVLDEDITYNSCADTDATYLLGYTIYHTPDGHIVVKAPLAEDKKIQASN